MNALLRLAENTYLLRDQKGECVVPPRRNDMEDGDKGAANNGRVLSMRQELDLVSCLTYLSAYSTHSHRVMALCVEEKADHEGLVVSVASNTSPDEKLEKGLKRITDILEKQTEIPSDSCLDFLLYHVLEHGRKRLDVRLGSVKPPSAGSEMKKYERTTSARLQKALECAQKSDRNFKVNHPDLFRLSAKFMELTEIVLASPTTSSVSDALKHILHITNDINVTYRETISQRLDRIPTNVMDPSTKESLKLRLEQLALYVPAASKLLRFAAKSTTRSLFRTIEVRQVVIGTGDLMTVFDGPVSGHATGLLESYLNGPKPARGANLADAMNKLRQKQKNLSILQKEIRDAVVGNTRDGRYKVHAEIQLLVACESNPKSAYPPRVFKSSKHACYLCDFVIKKHGKYYIPKTHGKLYNLWMFPDVHDCEWGRKRKKQWSSMIDEINAGVESLLLEKIRNPLILKNPRESSIFSLDPSVYHPTGVQQEETAVADEAVEEREDHPQDEPVGQTAHQNTSPAVVTSSELLGHAKTSQSMIALQEPVKDEAVAEEPIKDTVPIALMRQGTPQMTPLTARSIQSLDHNHAATKEEKPAKSRTKSLLSSPAAVKPTIVNLTPGRSKFHVFQASSKCIRYHTPKIHIELSHEEARHVASQSSPSRCAEPLLDIRTEVTWLNLYQSAAFSDVPAGNIVDLKSKKVWEVAEGVLFTDYGLLFRKGSETVRLKASYVEK
ncbi:hypothetical protein BS50DRAFT_295844 [Corynespora cassiicola Philippines]|uniref:Uncharacterized protein n=1 Tax=Corynespora cassiicola Philippines TaxID=1448308 RepID=A0A2T2NWE8_CORCC|nr:hypothetical protein BS50DRAFT_295844 [Corynespora cassiicola Philippines]